MTKYIVCGSSGFIGRNLSEMLIKEVDKRCPAIANMTEAQEELFDDDSKCEFVQADLSRQAMVDKAISGDYQVVVNCAGESELGLKQEVYDERVVQVTEAVAKAAAKIGAKFIQLSDARIYKTSKTPCKEDAAQKPWTKLAAAHLKAEQSLAKISGLNYTILRPSVVYGPGDRTGLMNRCVLAAIYKDNGKTMEMPFNANVKMSTVHVKDVAKAIIAATKTPSGSVFNVADPSNISLGEINTLLEQVFNIKTGFVSGAMNMALKAASGLAADVINDKHMTPWQELCKKKNIDQPILSPFMSPEVLIGDDLAIDGSKIVGVSGFQYKYPKPTAGLVLDMVNYFKKQGQFPK